MFLDRLFSRPDYLGKRECLVDSRLRVGCEEPRDGFLAEVTSVVDGSGRSVSTFECSVRDPPHGASFYIRFGLGGPVEFNGRSVKYAERVLNLVVEPTVDSEPNRWVELAGRQQKRATWLDAPNRTPRLGLIPDRVRVIRPSTAAVSLVPRRRASPDDVHPHLGYKP